MTTGAEGRAPRVHLAMGCLLLGSFIYLLARPTTLIMFDWVEALGLAQEVEAARSLLHDAVGQLPQWFVYSVPFALWVASYLLFNDAIWGRSTGWGRRGWFWCIPAVAVASEVLQGSGTLPGTFDPVDLLLVVVATASVILFDKSTELRQGAASK